MQRAGVSVIAGVGANGDSKPEHLLQFGRDWEKFITGITFGSRKQRVGLAFPPNR